MVKLHVTNFQPLSSNIFSHSKSSTSVTIFHTIGELFNSLSIICSKSTTNSIAPPTQRFLRISFTISLNQNRHDATYHFCRLHRRRFYWPSCCRDLHCQWHDRYLCTQWHLQRALLPFCTLPVWPNVLQLEVRLAAFCVLIYH